MKKLLAALLALAFSSAAFAQAYPNKPIRLIVPWPPGGPAEALARTVSTKMTEVMGQPFIIEAKPGANGTIGTAFVAKAAPDGYTILFSHLGPTAISPSLMKDLPYDPVKDFEPITQVISGPTLLVVRTGLPINSVAELIAHAKANPNAANYWGIMPSDEMHK